MASCTKVVFMAYVFGPEEFDQMLQDVGKEYRLYGPARYPNANPLSDTDLVTFGLMKSM